MPLYMSQFAYTGEAWAALARNPQDRSEAIAGLIEKVGGRLVSLHYCFGEYDGVLLLEAPDDTAILSALVAAVSPGHVKAIKTTRLFTTEETMGALRQAGQLTFRAPSAG